MNNILKNLVKTSNPQRKTMSESDMTWAATMLGMDLQSQNDSIFQEEEMADPPREHNKKMFKRMKEEKIPWTDEKYRKLNSVQLDELIDKYRDRKWSNEQVVEVVSVFHNNGVVFNLQNLV